MMFMLLRVWYVVDACCLNPSRMSCCVCAACHISCCIGWPTHWACMPPRLQPLAVDLTLEAYRASLAASSSAAAVLVYAVSAEAPQLAASTAEQESYHPGFTSALPCCELAAPFMLEWSDDEVRKPDGFDASTTLRLSGVADIAAVSCGGRANGRWKPDNQDAFLVQVTAPAAAAAAGVPASHSDKLEELPPAATAAAAAALIGVFDGHGRLGGAASALVRQAVAAQLSAARPQQHGTAQHSAPSAATELLGACFAAAEAAIRDSSRDFSKSGSTAVLALLEPGSLSVAWVGDSRAVLGVCTSTREPSSFPPAASATANTAGLAAMGPTPFATASSGSSSLASSSTSAAAGSVVNNSVDSSVDNSSSSAAAASYAAVPLTADHKPGVAREQQRIVAAGGRVTRVATDHRGQPMGPQRVFVADSWSPGLALSRSLGDTLAASVGVTAEPEMTLLTPHPPQEAPAQSATQPIAGLAHTSELAGSLDAACRPASGGGGRRVLIVASDGLWEWLSNATAVSIAAAAGSAEAAARALVEAAQQQWAVRYRGRSCDDVTVVVAFLES
ncbi:putative protein phosphatase 2C [Chlorella vulgaris]